MQARMTNPATVLPDTIKAVGVLYKAAHSTGLAPAILELVHLRASQINGCSVCVDMHAKALKKSGETDERLFAVAAWREAPYFDDDERAALALAESMTRLSDQADAVPDETWDEAAKHYTEEELATLTLSIATVNLWNRINAATRQVAGAWAG